MVKSLARSMVRRLFPRYSLYCRAFRILALCDDSYLRTTGWLRSFEEGRPVDMDGGALPWMNYAIIRFLKARLNKEMRLFEYGSGYSTQFFASLVQSVTSVEYDEAWYGLVKERIPRNVELVYKRNDEDGEYCRSIVATASKFHIVIVDGRDRVNCIKQSVGALTENGVIVLDDAQRERYAVGLDYARARGFKVLSFEGLKPTGSSNETAAILYRSENNCLDI